MSAVPQNQLSSRITSLDQFRGYTILGMFLVNYMGSFKAITPNILLHHNTYCSYADLIMPHFIFCVGFAFRLTFGRRDYTDGASKAYFRVVRRLMGLMLVTFSVYHVGRVSNTWEGLTNMTFWEIFENPMKRVWLQTLGQIALTSLWILPWLRSSTKTRVIFMICCGIGHQVACYFGYFLYANTNPNGIDGGPLGFLTWTIPALLGTLACDWVVDARVGEEKRHAPVGRMFAWSAAIMLLGWFISFPARLYDITPEEMATLKETEYRHRDRIAGRVAQLNKPHADRLAGFNKGLNDRAASLRARGFQKRQEIAVRMLTENGLDPESAFPTSEMYEAAYTEWETKYTDEYEGELGALYRGLDDYRKAIKSEIIRPDSAQEAFKQRTARRYEELLTAEMLRQTEIRRGLMKDAKLDPEKDTATKEIEAAAAEKFKTEPGEEVTSLRAEVADMKVKFQEQLSAYHTNLTQAKADLKSLEEVEDADAGKAKIAAQARVVTHLESQSEIEWNQLATYGWRDLKLAENPVMFDASRWKNMSFSQMIGRNPMAKPEYEDRRVVSYQPRDTFYWNSWMMSQRAGTVAYLVFSGGASLFFYTLFYIACDMKGLQVPLFRTWGTNALACYVLFELVCGAVKSFVPKDPVAWYGWGSWVLGMFLMWVVIRSFEKNKIYIRM